MKKSRLLFLPFLLFPLFSFAQVVFDADTVFLSSNGNNGEYEARIAITSNSTDLADLRWQQIEKILEPLVWTGFVTTCDSSFSAFAIDGHVTYQMNTNSCFLGTAMVNLDQGLPRSLNQMRLRVTSISDPNLNQELTYILNPVPVSTTNVLPASALSLSPNPSKAVLRLQIEEEQIALPAVVRLFNSNGQLTKEWNLNSNVSKVAVQDLSSGLYFLQIENEKGALVKKFLKQ